jgi:hypothetical protein
MWKKVAEMTEGQINELLERFDKSEKRMQRRIVAQLTLDSAVAAELMEQLAACQKAISDARQQAQEEMRRLCLSECKEARDQYAHEAATARQFSDVAGQLDATSKMVAVAYVTSAIEALSPPPAVPPVKET